MSYASLNRPPNKSNNCPKTSARQPGTFRLGAVDAPAERYADKIAAAMVGGSEQIRHDIGHDTMGHSGDTVALGAGLSTRLAAVTRQGGEPLNPDVRAPMENSLGVDLSPIRVHAGEGATAITRALETSALSVGNHLVFGRGQFRPNSETGQRLLMHEIAHTLQPGNDRIVRRSTSKPADLPAMGELIHLIWSDNPKEVTSDKLALLANERLATVRESAALRRTVHQDNLAKHATDGVGDDFSREFLADLVWLFDALLARIDATLELRGAVLESREFGKNAKNLRAAIVADVEAPWLKRVQDARNYLDSEALCFFDITLPKIPKFLKGMLTGREVSPSENDKLYAGYLDAGAVKSFSNKKLKVNPENLLASMTVAPLKNRAGAACRGRRRGHDEKGRRAGV